LAKEDGGFILLLSFFFMVLLVALVGALIYFVTNEAKDVAIQREDVQMVYLAEAGVERAFREIRDDYNTTTQTGTADLRGSDTNNSSNVDNDDRIRYIGEASGSATINNNSDIAQINTFDANYTNTRIVAVRLAARASRASGGTGATLQVSYTTNGSFPQAGNTVLTQALTTTMTTYTADITADRTWTWATLMSSNFNLRAVRTAGNRNINLDAIFLRVTYEIDTNTEAWSTGSYQAYPLSLGSGTVQSVSIVAEQGKVHLNTASQALLRHLMVENGIADATANMVATNIVSYRSTNKFDTIEEVQQVSGMTSAIYQAIDQDITVYSAINTNAQGPAGSRAPVNINTASQAVLEALFDPLTFDNASDIPSLASAIITQRNTAPFTCFYSSDSTVTTDFYDFVLAQAYLSSAEKDRVLGNADASALIPQSGGANQDTLTTELSYDTNAFKVESVGRVNSRNYRVKTIVGDQGGRTFTTFSGDTTAVGYRQENFE